MTPGRPAGRLPAAPVWPARPPGRVRTWTGDLLLGARLAVGGNRAGWLRVATVAVGLGFAVTVLLLAASVGNIRDAQDRRQLATALVTGPVPGVDPLHLQWSRDEYRGREIRLHRVRADGPRAPLPPGLERLPGPGEQVVSPGLARLLATPDADLLRSRYAGRTVGTVGPAGLLGGPDELVAYVGSADLETAPTYGFGGAVPPGGPLPQLLWVLVVVGVVVLLFPMFVLVAAVSRLSASERQRRLAAIRLVGAGSRQVHRIAAGEVLTGALLGLVAGAGLFLAARRLVEWAPVSGVAAYGGVRPFAADVVPERPLVLLVGVVVPVLAVATTLLALRGTLVEPLAVARAAPPAPPRLRWRLLPPLAGAALLVGLSRSPGRAEQLSGTVQLVAASVLLLLTVPVLLPWLLHQVVRRSWDATPALQLATRRLQEDSGPPARLFSGLAVTLTGAIALSALLATAQGRFLPPEPAGGRSVSVRVWPAGPDTVGLPGTLRALPGVTAVTEFDRVALLGPNGAVDVVAVAPCPVLRTLVRLPSCADGRWYRTGTGSADVAGRAAAVLSPDGRPGGTTLRVPARPEPVDAPADLSAGSLLTTPAALAAVPAELVEHRIALGLDGDPDTLEQVRAAVHAVGWRAETVQSYYPFSGTEEARSFREIRRGLLTAALLMLALGAAAVLVLCLQQVRDARRPLAALAAAGVPRAVLARALGWQNMIPLVLAVLLADAAGIALALLLLPVTAVPVAVDRSTVGLLSASALAAGAVVTALALPAVRAAAGPSGLRSE